MTRLDFAALLVALLAGCAASQPVTRGPVADNEVPFFEGLGDPRRKISTNNQSAQRYFDQGLTLLYAFNHKEAIRSFRSAATLDPKCAMAFWGVAYAFGPHVNKPMTEEDTAEAWKALQQAVALKGGVSPREQAYITALEQRYQSQHDADRSVRYRCKIEPAFIRGQLCASDREQITRRAR